MVSAKMAGADLQSLACATRLRRLLYRTFHPKATQWPFAFSRRSKV